jgi:hypothetical protein
MRTFRTAVRDKAKLTLSSRMSRTMLSFLPRIFYGLIFVVSLQTNVNGAQIIGKIFSGLPTSHNQS